MSTSCTDTPNAVESKYGQMTWLEIPIHDLARASKFYTEVLGWHVSSDGMPPPAGVTGFSKLFFFNKGDLHGAFLLMDEGAHILNSDVSNVSRCGVINSFAVPSIEDTLAKAKEHGGSTHSPKTDIGTGMGVFGRFIDSEGNMMGIWAEK